MLRVFRSFLNTWLARVFFVVLVAAFGLWGIGDVVRNIGHDNSLATVGSRKIQVPEFQEAFRRDLAQVTRMMGGKTEPTPQVRRTVAEQTLERMVIQAAIADEEDQLGIVVPDDKLRQAVFAMPVFRGKGGVFDHGIFDAVLRNNDLTEPGFLDMMRSDLAQRQLMESIQAGVLPPQTLLTQAYAFQHETRIGAVVALPLAAATAPPAPTADDLQRQYENNPAEYSAPAYRRVKLVVLSPQTLAKGITVTDAEIQTYYTQHKSDYVTEAQRAAEVIAAPDETSAKNLAAAWQAGADWAAMQKAATALHATAVALDLSTRGQFPSAALADAVFAATPGAVAGPIKSDFGYQVFKVTKAVAGLSKTLDQVRDQVRPKVAADRALDQVYTRANKLDDALSEGTSLDELPGDLGVAAVTGTLDAQGNTQQGAPAPIPGTPALRQAILKTIFSTGKGETPRMIEGPDQSYYALQVEDIIEPRVKPLADVRAQVLADWVRAQRRHEQNSEAASLMTAAQAGGSLQQAAALAGLQVQKTPPVPRLGQADQVPSAVQTALFQLKQGETTMVETPDGFAVVRLDQITDPDPAQDPAGVAQLRDALTKAMDQDVEVVFASALRDREQPRVNRTLLDSLSE